MVSCASLYTMSLISGCRACPGPRSRRAPGAHQCSTNHTRGARTCNFLGLEMKDERHGPVSHSPTGTDRLQKSSSNKRASLKERGRQLEGESKSWGTPGAAPSTLALTGTQKVLSSCLLGGQVDGWVGGVNGGTSGQRDRWRGGGLGGWVDECVGGWVNTQGYQYESEF